MSRLLFVRREAEKKFHIQIRSGSVLQLQGVIRLGNFHSSNVSHTQLHRSTAVQYQINQPPTAAYKTTTHDLIQPLNSTVTQTGTEITDLQLLCKGSSHQLMQVTF